MFPVIALITEVVANLPKMIELGMNVGNLISNTKAVITAVGAPDDPTWKALDAKVDELMARLNADPPPYEPPPAPPPTEPEPSSDA